MGLQTILKDVKTKIVIFQPGQGTLTVCPGPLNYFISIESLSMTILFRH